ncbi:MAG: hypothetical protein JWP11_38 [Frankiales bacterium]|nr:hypothetical protein [Frankiales bacterium]
MVKRARVIAGDTGMRIDEVLAETDPLKRAVRAAGFISQLI